MKSLFLVLAAVAAVGCGGPPSQLEACKHFCDKQGSCTNATSSVISQCKSECDAQKAMWSDNDKLIENNCANADSVKVQIYNCYGDYCDTTLVQNCADDVARSKCEPK